MNSSLQLLLTLLCLAAALGAGLWGSYWKERAKGLGQFSPESANLAELSTSVEQLKSQYQSLQERLDSLGDAAGSGDLDALIDQEELQTKLSELRALPWLDQPELVSRNKESLGAHIQALMLKEHAASYWQDKARAWSRLGLLEEDSDLFSQLLELRTSERSALYDPLEKRVYLLPSSKLQEPGSRNRRELSYSMAQQLVDQHFLSNNLPRYQEHNDDAVLAIETLIAADASLCMEGLAPNSQSLGSALLANSAQVDDNVAPVADLSHIAEFLRRRQTFSVFYGNKFANALQQASSKEDPWQQLNAAYSRPPVSTAELLEPSLYLERWQPTSIRAKKPLNALGTLVHDNVIGQWALGQLFALHLSEQDSVAAARGWSADRYWLFENNSPEDREEGAAPEADNPQSSGELLLWALSWRSKEDYERALSTFLRYYESRHGTAPQQQDELVHFWQLDATEQLLIATLPGQQSFVILQGDAARLAELRAQVLGGELLHFAR